MALVAGSLFAEYTILKLLGSGGMGKVYLAQHPRLPRRDAIKILRRALSTDNQYRERFQREADAAATLFHPNIVGVHDRGEYRGRLWIAMDYIDGKDIGQLMRRRFPGGMPAEDALAIVAAVADALDYAHQQGIVHRDVKPGNILLTNAPNGEQRIMLADFGIARQLSDPSGLTESNLAIGTVAYAAPEQLLGSDGLGRADQYALAATLFDLLTGAPPFENDNPVTVISQHLSAPPPLLSERRPELAELDDVLCAGLAKDPDDRYNNCAEFVEALTKRLEASSDGRPNGSVSTLIAKVVKPEAQAPAGKSRQRFVTRKKVLAGIPVMLGAVAAAVVVAHLGGDRQHDSIPTARGPAGTMNPATVANPAPPAGQRPSRAAAAPPALNGTYRVDANRAGQKYNGVPNPQPPNVSTWWAVRSSCTADRCTATAVMLDDDSHQAAAPPSSAGSRLVLDFADGSWRSRPETVQFACVSGDGTPGTQTTTQVLSLQPTIQGVLHGAMVVTVQTDECGQRGAQIWVPAVATRLGDAPADVAVPSLAGASAPASAPAG